MPSFTRLSSLVAAAAIALLATGCRGFIDFTHELRDQHSLTRDELKNLQFYTSSTITLRRELESGGKQITGNHKLLLVAGKTIEEVVIESRTPGIAVAVSDHSITVSFEQGTSLEFVASGNGARWYEVTRHLRHDLLWMHAHFTPRRYVFRDAMRARLPHFRLLTRIGRRGRLIICIGRDALTHHAQHIVFNRPDCPQQARRRPGLSHSALDIPYRSEPPRAQASRPADDDASNFFPPNGTDHVGYSYDVLPLTALLLMLSLRLRSSLEVDGHWRQHEKAHSQCASIP